MRSDRVTGRGVPAETERERGMEWDAFQSVIPDVIHKPDAQINAIWERKGERERGRRSVDGWEVEGWDGVVVNDQK